MLPQGYLDRNSPPHITTLVLIASIGAISLSIFLASLPEMARYFNVPYSLMQIAITGYLALTSIAHLLLGPISDRYGRRPVMLISIILFILATIGAITSTSFEAFIVYRILQSVIVSGLVLSRTIVRDLVAREQAASMIGYVTMGMALAPMLAPPLGGYLAELFGWQSNFHFLSLFGVVVFIVCWFDLGETNKHKMSSFAEQLKSYPNLLKSRRFWGYALTAAFSAGTFFAYLGGAPFVGSEIYGLTSAQIGTYLMLTPIGYMAGNGISGRYTNTYGIYKMITIGIIITILGMGGSLFCILAGWQHPLSFFLFTISIGLGNGMTLPSANAGMLDVRPELAGSASGLGGALMTLGGAAFSTLSGVLLSTASGPLPLVLCIILASILALIFALYTIRIEKQLA
jgi:DHA1 family bicyclomycin/chloramphenicol resistance-like MFS transporter